MAVALQPWMTLLVALCGFTCMGWNPSRERPRGSLGLLRPPPTGPSPCSQPPTHPQSEAKSPQGQKTKKTAFKTVGWRGLATPAGIPSAPSGEHPGVAADHPSLTSCTSFRLGSPPALCAPTSLRRWLWRVVGCLAMSHLGVRPAAWVHLWAITPAGPWQMRPLLTIPGTLALGLVPLLTVPAVCVVMGAWWSR